MTVLIREANRGDSSTVLRFVKELAAYEKAEHEVLATEQTLFFLSILRLKPSSVRKKGSQLALLCIFLIIQRG